MRVDVSVFACQRIRVCFSLCRVMVCFSLTLSISLSLSFFLFASTILILLQSIQHFLPFSYLISFSRRLVSRCFVVHHVLIGMLILQSFVSPCFDVNLLIDFTPSSSWRSTESQRHLSQFDSHSSRVETTGRKGTIRYHPWLPNSRTRSRPEGGLSYFCCCLCCN